LLEKGKGEKREEEKHEESGKGEERGVFPGTSHGNKLTPLMSFYREFWKKGERGGGKERGGRETKGRREKGKRGGERK